MNRDGYHHGDLKKELIDNGLLLLNREGIEKFSLRKVASMCGVSHTAPYKHFKDKEELIDAIVQEVWKNFYLALSEVNIKYPIEAKLKIVEMGKTYVRFMVENPQYLKFMFLADNEHPIKIKNNKFYHYEGSAFEVFKKCSEEFFKEINLDENLYIDRTLVMWSMVHGIALLISKKSIEYEGNYLELVERMIKGGLGI